MADYDILYPARKRQGFDGGKNNKFEKHLIADNESPDTKNVIFENGAVETRPGTSKFNTGAVGSFIGDGIYTRHDRSNNTETMCVFFGGMLLVNSGTTFITVPSAQSVFTAGVRVGSSEYENYIFFGNGTTPYKYNGAFTRHGVPEPTQTATVASSATGSLTGDYKYAYTNVNSNLVESDLSPVTVTFTGASATALISAIATAPASHGVNARYLYRTKQNSFATYFRVKQLNDNTTTSTTDNVIDASLGVEAPRDNGVPPNYSTIISHQNRLFCNDTAEPKLVWYSELDNPYTFGASNFIPFGDDAGDLVRGLAVHDNGLLVFCDQSTYLLYMQDTDPANWTRVKLKSSYGSKSPFGFFSYNNKVMFPAHQSSKLVGFAAISGDAVDPEATLLTVSAAGSEMKSDRIEPDIFDIVDSAISRISSIVYKNRAYMTVTYGSGTSTNNRIYCFDFSISNLSKKQEASWVPWTGLNAEQFTVYGGSLYYQSSTATGYVYEMLKEGQFNDDGAAIDSYYWTKEYSGNPTDEQNQKDFRYTNLLYEKAGDYSMLLTYRVDSDLGGGDTKQIDLNPGGSLWGTMMWGRDSWGGGNAEGEDRIYFGQLRGKRLQLKFSNMNTVNQKFKIIGMQFSYNRKGRR